MGLGLLAVLVICAAAVLVYDGYTKTHYEITFYQETSKKVSRNIRLAVIADLHNREYGEGNATLIGDVRALHPDLILITDYSSVFFDVGYMEKPVIYYQFDQEEFWKIHYQKGYFSYEAHGFGSVVETEEALMAALRACAESGFKMEKQYMERLEAFFPVRDERNCERT